jgi:hypothetical protein
MLQVGGKFKDVVNLCKPILSTLQKVEKDFILEDLKQYGQLFTHFPRSEEDVVGESFVPGVALVTSQVTAVEEQVWHTSESN